MGTQVIKNVPPRQQPIGINGPPHAPVAQGTRPLATDPDAILRRADSLARQEAFVNLGAMVEQAFQEALLHRSSSGIDSRYLECQRRKKGEYEAGLKAEIEKIGGSTAYSNLTEMKTSAAEAWIRDVFLPLKEIFSLEPSPIPDLSPDMEKLIVKNVIAEFANQDGEPGPEPNPDDVFDFTVLHMEKVLEDLIEVAKRRTKAHERLIQDQLKEGGFVNAFNDFIENLTIYPIAILKGPIIRHKRVMKYNNETGKLEFRTELIPCFEAPDPFDVYFSPNSRKVGDGYVVEVVRFDPNDLKTMKGSAGWIDDAIDAVLVEHGKANTKSEFPDAERPGAPEHRELADQDMVQDDFIGAAIRGKLFWGQVSAIELKKMRVKLKKDTEITSFHEVCVLKIGKHIVRVMLNPDPLGRRPYYVTSFEKQPNSLYGKAICEKIEDIQDNYNAVIRALMNNVALSSGPQSSVDIDAIVEGTDIYRQFPFKVWPYDGSRNPNQTPVAYFQPDLNAAELLNVAEYFETKADDRTLIPRFAHGDQDASGAAQTARGLNMLMSAAARGIKRVMGFIDEDVLIPIITAMYTWNLIYKDSPEIRADSFVVPSGALAKLVEESALVQQQEFATLTQNDIDLRIMGEDGRAELLREISKGIGIDPKNVIPSAEEMQKRERERLQAEADSTAKAQLEQQQRQELAEQQLAAKVVKSTQA